MSALSPAPAPALGVRWTDLPTPLDSIHPSCCLSYKQSACLSALFSWSYKSLFPQVLSFHIYLRCPLVFSLEPSDSRLLRTAPGWRANVFNSLQPLFLSCVSFRSVRRLFSEAYSLFCRKQGSG